MLVAYALVGVVAGIVWERVWTLPAEIVQQHKPYYVDYGSLRRVFTGTGLYVLVGGAASALVALVVTPAHPATASCSPSSRSRSVRPSPRC